MRFHFVDRIDAHEAGRSIRARKLTSHQEEFWDRTGGGPIMPPPLVLEALGQAGGWLVYLSTDGRKRAALASIGSASFFDDVRPGDTLELEAIIESLSDEVAVLSGTVSVGDRRILSAVDVMCVLLDPELLDTRVATEAMRTSLLKPA